MNRKLLLGTTALVAGGVVAASVAEAANPLRLEVRGYKHEYFGVSSVESDVTDENFGNTALRSDGEVHFRGETTLDNGITVGVRVELEAFGNTGDQVDENYVYLEGGFGRAVLGSDDPAPYVMAVVAPNVAIPINSGWLSDFIPEPATFTTGAFSTTPEISADDNMLTYYSPRFFGLQFGASYIPSFAGSAADANPPFGNGEGNNSINNDTDRDHGVAAGLNFSNSFNGVDINAAAGIQYVDEPDESVAGVNDEDVTAYNAGVNIGFGGFTVGGSIGGFDADDAANDGYHWDIGVSYETGPWGVSATFIAGEREGTAGGDEDESMGLGVGLSYALGPGISTRFGVLWADYDEENGDDGSGFGAVGGITVNF